MGYVALSGMTAEGGDVELVVPYCKVLLQHFLGRNEKTHRNLHRITGPCAKI
jgi:hypothetical protein